MTGFEKNPCHNEGMDTDRLTTERVLPDTLTLASKDAAGLLGISRAHFWKLNGLGKLPAPVRLGRVVRWRRDELIRWLNAGCPCRERWEATQARGRSQRSTQGTTGIE